MFLVWRYSTTAVVLKRSLMLCMGVIVSRQPAFWCDIGNSPAIVRHTLIAF